MKRTVLLWLLSVIVLMTFVIPAYAANPIPVEKITLSSKSVMVPVGKTVSIKASVEPKNATVKTLKWSSSDESVVTVKNGSIKGVACGEATVTVKATDNSGVSAKVKVTVVQSVKKITFSEKTVDLAAGVYHKLKVKVEPSNASVKSLSWTSSNEKVAKVDKKGIVTGIGKGTARITATATDGSNAKASVTVKVNEYYLVFTSKRPQNVKYTWSGSGNYKINGSVKNGNVSIPNIKESGWRSSGQSTESVEVTPMHSGADVVIIQFNKQKLEYPVFVADYFKDNEIQYVQVPDTSPKKSNGSFQDIVYGTSYSKAKKQLEKAFGSNPKMNDYGYGFVVKYNNPGIQVAGHDVVALELNFCYDEDKNGNIVKDEKTSSFFQGTYYFSYKENNSIAEDLYNKLTKKYGKTRDEFKEDDFGDIPSSFDWTDKNVYIELDISSEVSLDYLWSPGFSKRAILRGTYEYLLKLEEQKKKEAEQDKYGSSMDGL